MPTHNRPALLISLLSQLRMQECDVVVVVDNASDPPLNSDHLLQFHPQVVVIHDGEQPPNLYRLWNVAFDWIAGAEDGSEHWDVAVFNDDTVLPSGWFAAVTDALRGYDVVLASGDAYGHVRSPIVRRGPDGVLVTRMCPWAFVVRGEAGLRADETLRWWWGDTDFEWTARLNGGTVVLPGLVARNTCANSSTVGVLAEQAGRDAETFTRKWGWRPW